MPSHTDFGYKEKLFAFVLAGMAFASTFGVTFWNALNFILMCITAEALMRRRQDKLLGMKSISSRVYRAVRWASVLPVTILGTEGFGLPAPYLISAPFMFSNKWLPNLVLLPFACLSVFFACFMVAPVWREAMRKGRDTSK